ncbi:biotin synthase BioB [Candidatus Margulisiibacteriota bacterium]
MKIGNLASKSLQNQEITHSEALSILETNDPYSVFEAANKIREHFKGKKINLCSISNAKSGKCSENCKFCAQSAHYKTAVTPYSLKNKSDILKEIQKAVKNKAERFSIVTSGKSILSDKEYEIILETIAQYPPVMGKCASLGTLSFKQCKMLKEAGLETYHHNLETARSFYPQICTTHTYEERLETLKNAKAAGLNLCSGGIFGLGETLEQRVELAFALKEVDPDGIPLNFLSPIPGTPLEDMPVLEPLEALKIIAMFRFVHPDKTIRIGGGREKALGNLQPLMFIAGANAVLTGNYLTTAGKTPQDDHEMIKELGLTY